jgi:hypothetical protein
MPDQAPIDGPDDETIASLTASLDEVQDELAGIRRVVDEIQGDLEWVTRNPRADEWRPIQPITSIPFNPLAADWAERVNRFTAADIPQAESLAEPATASTAAGDGPAEDDDDAEQLVFCCDSPALIWTGHPDYPGVGCANCGYMVADCGSVVMSPPPDVHGCELPLEPPGPEQRQLF